MSSEDAATAALPSLSVAEHVSLRHRIEAAIDGWRDTLNDPPACLYDPDLVKEMAREARDLVERRIKEHSPLPEGRGAVSAWEELRKIVLHDRELNEILAGENGAPSSERVEGNKKIIGERARGRACMCDDILLYMESLEAEEASGA